MEMSHVDVLEKDEEFKNEEFLSSRPPLRTFGRKIEISCFTWLLVNHLSGPPSTSQDLLGRFTTLQSDRKVPVFLKLLNQLPGLSSTSEL